MGEYKSRFNSRHERITHFEKMCKQFNVEVDVVPLIEMGFFDGPSSINHHGCYEGGNYDHSVEVAEKLIDLTNKGLAVWKNPRSPWVVGIFHDICKADTYEEKPREDGKPRSWDYKEKQYLSGHGDKSVMMLSSMLRLTEEEMLCIRYHMGAYRKEDWDCYDMAIRKYETVLWTHTADMYAAKVKNI